MTLKTNINWAIVVLLSLWTLASSAQDTIQHINFDNYEAGAGLSTQAPAEWFTWNNGPGTKEDPVVTDEQSLTGSNSLLVTGTNDILLDLGSKSSGRYELSFNFYIPGGKTGLFGLLQNFNATKSQWGFQCLLDAGSQGKILAAGNSFVFFYTYSQWNPVRIIVDLDNDHAEFYYKEILITEWQWSKQFDGKEGILQLDAIDFFAWNTAQREPLFYVDQVIFSKLQAPPAPTNLQAEITEDDVKLTWNKPVNAEPLLYKVYRDGLVIAPLVYDTTFMDMDVYPGSYSYSVKASYESGLSNEAGPVEVTIVGGIERKMVLLEIATGTWCTYCPGSAMGADDLVNNGKNIAVIEYHDADAYANNASDFRNNFYNVPGFPTAHFDGQNQIAEGNATQSMYPEYLPVYEQRIEKLALFDLAMEITQVESRELDVQLTVKKIFTYPGNNLRLHLVLTESHIPEEWQVIMDELNFVCREMYPDHKGTTVDFNSDSTFSVNFRVSIDQNFNIDHCELVAFLQDNSSREVLQADKFSLATLGMNNLENTHLSIFPNPSTNWLHVRSDVSIKSISLRDISGREMMQMQVDSNNIQFHVSHLNDGVYFLYIKTEKGISVRKFIKSKA